MAGYSKIDLKNYEIPGCVLVFNHSNFDTLGLENRDGTENDVVNLKESFEQTFKFKFRVFNDLKYVEIQKTLMNYADPDNSDKDPEWVDLRKCGSLVIVVLTHGRQGGMACRSDQGNVEITGTKEKLIEIEKSYRITERTHPHADVMLPRIPNTLVFFSTVERNQVCKEVRNWSADYGLLAMVKRVTSSVVELGLDRLIGQTPTCVSFLTSDVVNSVKKAVIRIRMPTAETNSTSGSIDSTVTHLTTDSSTCSSSTEIKPLAFFDTILIESDAGSGKVNNEMPRYVWNTQYAGRAYIFYDSHHEDEAEYLRSIAENKMGLCTIFKEISTTEEVIKDVKSLITSAFLSTACTTLAAKPEIFLFLDKDSEKEKSDIVSDSPNEKLNFASQHSDMIFVRAISQEFLTNFLTELESKCQHEDLMQIVTNSIGKMITIPCDKMLPHLESTLLRDLIFPLERKEPLNLDNLESGTNGPGLEYPCENFVGRKAELKELCDYFYLTGVNESRIMADVAISGPIGSGKSQLVRTLKQECELPFQNWILIKSTKENKQGRPLLRSLTALGGKTLIVFEDFKRSDAQDLAYLSTFSNLYTIILSREDCSHISQKHIKLGGLEEDDAKELCKKIYENETDDDLMKRFTSTFHNHPLALEIMCKFTKNRQEDKELIGETYTYADTLNEFNDNKYCMFITEDVEDQQIIETDDYGILSREEWDEICKENGF
ncbi:hypothetical protein B566_EDAN014767 [Ephemera danica]|nr:hypothetical protein B566_EDAN014767 [Ephemera danica]